ncbi:MAG: hypothetical protein DU429_06795 [Candidatus Tokpelaia sp.]|nr:MAG: hypothetical protein DU430_07230 [Candidatus Tokpelaia sp.]KAA6206122.1 MAG: hypothetical protein DU429_06795 [Candidatus Tokpelaia sp.]
MQQDLGFLSFCEEGRALAVDLLKKWLVKYKFKNWLCHRTHNGGKLCLRQRGSKGQRKLQLYCPIMPIDIHTSA